MKNLQATIEEAMRQGLSLDEVMEMVGNASDAILNEQVREDEVAEARMKAAEAMANYLYILTGSEPRPEIMYECLEMSEEMLTAMVCEPKFPTSETVESEPKIKVIELNCSEAEDAFAKILKKLGI